MREIRQSGLEGGVRSIPHSYPYQKSERPRPLGAFVASCEKRPRPVPIHSGGNPSKKPQRGDRTRARGKRPGFGPLPFSGAL